MELRVGVTEARARISELVDRVRYHTATVVLLKSGKPAAVLIPVELYERMNAAIAAYDRLLQNSGRKRE